LPNYRLTAVGYRLIFLGRRPFDRPSPPPRVKVSAEADTRHEVPQEDDFNRLNSYPESLE